MKILILILFMLVGVGCSSFHKDDVLLQIGHYKLTVADYEFIRNSTKYQKRSNEQLQSDLLEEGFMIAFALEHKYDTIGILSKQLDYATYYYVSKVDGYVWNREVKPLLKVAENDIQNAYHMRSHEYHLNLMCFPDERSLRKYYNSDCPLKSEKNFFSLQRKIVSDLHVKSSNESMRYPFCSLGGCANDILDAKIGDVLGPLETLNGYYIIHVEAIKKVLLPSYEQEKNVISQELLRNLAEKYIWESQKEIISATKPKMYEDVIDEVASTVDVEGKKWPSVNRDMVLMEYELNGTRQYYTVADFIEFVHFQPVFFGSLSTPDDIKKMLKTNLINSYLFAKAQQMDMERDEEYQQFKKRYQHSIFLHHYKQENIYPNIFLRDKEIRDFYQKHQSDLKCFESASIIEYCFKDLNDALKGRMQILSEPESLKDLKIVSKKKNLFAKIEKVHIEISKSNYDKRIIDLISHLNIGQVSAPLKIDDGYRIIQLTSKCGSIATPFKYVKDEVKQRLTFIKEQEITLQQLQKLKILYPIVVNRMKEYAERY